MNPLRRDAADADDGAAHGAAHGAAQGPADGEARQTVTYPDLPSDQEWALNAQEILAQREQDEDDDTPADPDDDDYYEEDYEDAGAGFFDLVWEYKVYVVAAALVCVALVGALIAMTGGGGPDATAPPADPAPSRSKPEAAAPAPRGEMPVEDTGVAIEEPVVKEDANTYYLRAGEIAWKGKLQDTDSGGEQLTLEGPTASQFKRITLPGGSMTTGVFGRAEPGKPIIHATFHRMTVGEEETTSGTYYAIDQDRVIAEGTYEDARDGQTVTRTYTEHSPGSDDYHSYRVSFEVPLGVPVPVLIGWEPPAEAEIDEAA